MPFYPFRCPTCGNEFELKRAMKDAGDPAPCPKDGTIATRIFVATAIVGGRRSEESSESSDSPPAMPDFGHDHGHGHSHGPGGHMH